ncbi:MAG: hypothetical protein JWO72_1009 [Caulobacteraceae bacterium]|nr:hypothetical protein [Caulobacteraceae bacterium]
MTRPMLAALAALGLALAANAPRAHAEPPAAPADQMRLQGIWQLVGEHSTIKTVDGRLPPFKPAAKARYEAAVAARRAGKPIGDTAQKCLPPGLPRAMFYPQPVLITVEPKQVTFLHELMHLHRMVYIGDALPSNDDLDQNWLGFSAGRWEKGDLIVQSRGFNDVTTIDTAGIPHSTDLLLTEKLHLADKDTLVDTITIDDPKTFAAPWQTRVTFKRLPDTTEFREYVCTDVNPEAVAAK